MRRIILRTFLIAATVFVLVCSASAQSKYGITKRINFKPGTSSTRIVSMLKSGREVHEYHFRVRAGQRVHVDLVSNDKDISFYIMTIPDGYMMTTEEAVRSFNDTLPDTGEYKIVISTEYRGASKYALEMRVDPTD
jgi:hypothetical protein